MYLDYLFISLRSSGIGRRSRGCGRGEALQEALSLSGHQAGAGGKRWRGASKPWLTLWLAGQGEMQTGTIGKVRRRWEEQGIWHGWCPSAAPQLFDPVSLKSVTRRSPPWGKGTHGKALLCKAGAHPWVARYSQFILTYTHFHPPIVGAVRIPWSTGEKAEFSKVTCDFPHFQN